MTLTLRPNRYRNFVSGCRVTLVFVAFTSSVFGADTFSREQSDFFESEIRPLLIEHCYECHSDESDDPDGNLRLDTARSTLAGGDLGPALVPGKPDSSLMIKAIEYQDSNLQMPPSRKLKANEVQKIRDWIAMGAPDTRTDSISDNVNDASPADRTYALNNGLQHWAFVPPQQSAGPSDVPPSSRDIIDGFVSQNAIEHGLVLNAEAEREVLIRRLYFDLSGLAPDIDMINRFVQSDHPAAYERIVDGLLASPEFAERFGRHWLDVARYADTLGYTTAGKPREIIGSERFRDWVIRAFADDMPYDEMLRLQLSADRMDPNNSDGNLDAMGFLTIGRRFLNAHDTIDDRIDVISRGLIGLTVTCARCHDHKFDPISTIDYYGMYSVLANSEQQVDGPSPLMMTDKNRIIDHRVFIRGQASNHGPIAPRQFLTALRKPDEPNFRDGSGRSELAFRIASSENPLTARVMVNRLWTHLVGRPLVDSPSDFGVRTQPPHVPEVLDDLAADFSRHWSIKRTVRRIVLSAIYRQSCQPTEAAIAMDPENRMLCRGNRRRRDFESLRDNLLVAADSLDRTVGGKSIEVTLDTPAPRRTIYAKIDRQNLPPIFRTFDFASPDAHSAGRYYTTVPQQALYLVNSRQIVDLANRVATAARRDVATSSSRNEIESIFRRVLKRNPSAQEREWVSDFLEQPASPVPETIDARRLWSYGTATIDENSRVTHFRKFAKYRKGQWQADSDFPSHGPLAYAHLGQENGHPGEGKSGAVVRRFTSPMTGRVEITGMMGHLAKEGDGVRTAIRIEDQSVFKYTQKGNRRPYGLLMSEVKQGQHIDFIASAGDSASHDTFFWRMRIKVFSDDGRIFETESTRDFSGPLGKVDHQTLGRFAQLAHLLLMSNEFAFVD